MNILIHARHRERYEDLRATLEAQQHRVQGAFSFEEDRQKMLEGPHDKVFIGTGVPIYDRLSLMTLAGELRMSIIEIIDSNTVTKETRMHVHPARSMRAMAEAGR